MKYAIIGFGQIGTALARIFAHKNIEVGIANSRRPETIESTHLSGHAPRTFPLRH